MRTQLLSVIVALGLALGGLPAALGGCGGRGSDEAGIVLPADVSPTVAVAAARQAELLTEPDPVAAAAADARLFNWYRRALHDPALGPAAADSFFAVWGRTPTHVLWIELSVLEGRTLRQAARRDSLLQLAAGDDTTSARHHFVSGRRVWTRQPGAAAAHYRRAAAAADPADTLTWFWTQLRLARIEHDAGDTDGAILRCCELVPVAWLAGGPALAGMCWQDLSWIANRSGRLGDALAAARLAEACALRAADPFPLVRARLALARAHQERGEFGRADSLYAVSYATARDSGLTRLQGYTTGLMAGLARRQGDVTAEIAMLERGLDSARAGADSNAAIRIVTALGDANRRLGRLDSASVWFDRGGTMAAIWRGGRLAAHVDRGRAILLHQLGDYAAAESLRVGGLRPGSAARTPSAAVQLQISLVRQGLETNHPDLAYRALGQARKLLADGVPTTSGFDPELQVGLVAAQLHARQGEFHLADAALESVGARAARAPTEVAWYVAETRALVAAQADDPQSALTWWSRAAALADTLNDPDLIRRSRVQLAGSMLATGRNPEAAELVAADLNAPEYWTSLNAHIITAMAANRDGRPQQALAALAPAEARLTRDAPTDLAARVGLERGRALTGLDRPREALAALQATRSLLGETGGVGRTDIGRSFNAGIVREVAESLLCLLMDNPELAGAASSRAVGAWGRGRDVPAARSPRIEYFIGGERGFAWAGGGAEQPLRWHEVPPTAELEDLVVSVATDMGYPGRSVDAAAAAQLADALLSPLGDAWHAGAVLEVVPDGALHAVPWTALPWPAGPGGAREPALANGPVVIVSGPGATAHDGSAASGLLVVGSDGGADPSSPRLRAAEQEAQAIAELWQGGPVRLYLGSRGDELDLVEINLTDVRALHISSHTRVYEGADGNSAIHIAGRDGLPLTLNQLAGSRLAAELVFLSGCEGARRHRAAGHGVVSFADAFLTAGADGVIASTVLLEDEAARHVAESFYIAWLGGEERAAALRTALLGLARDDSPWSHPFYWAHYNHYRRPGS